MYSLYGDLSRQQQQSRHGRRKKKAIIKKKSKVVTNKLQDVLNWCSTVIADWAAVDVGFLAGREAGWRRRGVVLVVGSVGCMSSSGIVVVVVVVVGSWWWSWVVARGVFLVSGAAGLAKKALYWVHVLL